MPEAIILAGNRIGLTGLTGLSARDDRLAIATRIERLDWAGSTVVADVLKGAGPAVTVARQDEPFLVRAWLGRELCVWTTPSPDDLSSDESVVDLTPSGQIAEGIARVLGLCPGPERGEDAKPLLFDQEQFAAYSADEGIRHWRVRIDAGDESGNSSSFEVVKHSTLGWFIAPEGTGSAPISLFPTDARGLWLLLLSLLGDALPVAE